MLHSIAIRQFLVYDVMNDFPVMQYEVFHGLFGALLNHILAEFPAGSRGMLVTPGQWEGEEGAIPSTLSASLQILTGSTFAT